MAPCIPCSIYVSFSPYFLTAITRDAMSRRKKQAGEPIKAIAYLRTSSASNVGADKDSDKRQREAIEAFSGRSGYQIVAEYYDAAVSGADPITSRRGFAAMLERITGNGVRTII